MIDFNLYNYSSFKNDLETFFSTIPDESKFHDDRENKLIYTIQQERLTEKYNHLDFLNGEQLENFAVALYFVVLFDMIFCKYYGQEYKRFQKLTFYPKFIGNCSKACHLHIHPKNILLVLQKRKNMSYNELNFNQKIDEFQSIMKYEIIRFLENKFPEINGLSFWDKYQKELEE
jgi:hypothetical protein